MNKFLQPSNQVQVSVRHRMSRGPSTQVRMPDVQEAPLTDAQRSALEATAAIAALGALRPVRTPGQTRRMAFAAPVDATAGGRFQGWRVP
jgi:hypothetical protein